jgi:hypothetical protein
MKQCPRCKQTYSDENLNFCLEDGELLTVFGYEPPASRYVDEPPPTVMLNEARVTNPANWPGSQPISRPTGQQNIQHQPFTAPAFALSRDKTLPTISLILGIASLVLMCCYGGIWLGVPAAVLGFLGMKNADRDPGRYEGRGLAIAGMVLGGVSLLASVAFAFIAILSR